MNRQDMQPARTVNQVEYKYGQSFSEVLGIAESAEKTAKNAVTAVQDFDASLTQSEVFNRLTNNGEWKGLYRDDKGNIYINADYIKAGILIAQAVNAVSESSGAYVEIRDGRLIAGAKGKDGESDAPFFSIYPLAAASGAWAVALNNILDTGERVTGSMTYKSLELGSVDQEKGCVKIEAIAGAGGRAPAAKFLLPKTDTHPNDYVKELYAYWEPVGNGKYTLVGYEQDLEVTEDNL